MRFKQKLVSLVLARPMIPELDVVELPSVKAEKEEEEEEEEEELRRSRRRRR